MSIPDELAGLLQGSPNVDQDEQAFPFLTVDDHGYPHCALLSRSEIDVDDTRGEILTVVRATRTRANIERDGRALLIAIGETTAHYVKLGVVRSLIAQGTLAAAWRVDEHVGDTLGIPLTPITFRTSAELARYERWEVSATLFERLLAD